MHDIFPVFISKLASILAFNGHSVLLFIVFVCLVSK